MVHFLKKVLSLFKKNHTLEEKPKNPIVINKDLPAQDLPDVSTLEQTMFMLQRVRTVFDFSPPIPLIAEMRILNKGLSYAYQSPRTQPSSEDKNSISVEVTQTVQKFSHILPDIELLLTKIETLPVNDEGNQEAEEIKKKIVYALEKVSYEKNSLTSISYNKNDNITVNYDISFDDNK